MPSRSFTATSSYRYGFNGKELDRETTGTTTYDYGFRIYNPGLGRFLSVDALTQSYPWYTPYQFAGNMPIAAIDLDGLEPYTVTVQCFEPYDYFGRNYIEDVNVYWNHLLIFPIVTPAYVYYLGDGDGRRFGDGGTFRTSGSMTVDPSFRNYVPASVSTNITTESEKYKDGNLVKTDRSPTNTKRTGDVTHIKKSNSIETVEFAFHSFGSNKVSTGGQFVDIDNHINATLTKDVSKGILNIKGSGYGDKFPSVEAFITDNIGNKVILGAAGHNGPNENMGPFLNLPGDNMRFLFKFNFSINIDKDGNFKSVSHTNSKGKTTEYSLESWNKMFKNLDARNTNTSTSITNDSDMRFENNNFNFFSPWRL